LAVEDFLLETPVEAPVEIPVETPVVIEDSIETPVEISSLSPLEARRLAKLESCKEYSDLGKVHVIYVPGKGVPTHVPMFFGRPFEVWLTPNVPTEVPGRTAKLLSCEFPKIIFMDDGNGNPVPFPSNNEKNASKQNKGAPKK
jgi:hypothetical protein